MALNLTTAALANNSNTLASDSRRAYVTLLAGDGDYWKGVVGLAKGLRKVKSKYPLVVAVLADVPEDHREILRSQGCIIKEIEPIYPPENQTQTEFAKAVFVINYSKLRVWKFVKYSKMIYLDADIQVLRNIDDMFDLPDGNFYAVMDCFCETKWEHSSPHNKIGYCQRCADRVQWPAEMGPKPTIYFNDAMFVFEPNLSTYDNLLDRVKIATPTPSGEQDLLNMFFKDIYIPISPIYNVSLALLLLHPDSIEFEKIKVAHYSAAGSKPWRYTGEEENMNREDIKTLINKWWDIFGDESLDYKKTVADNEEDKGCLQSFMTALVGCFMAENNLSD